MDGVNGPLSYNIKLKDGSLVCRHVDSIKSGYHNWYFNWDLIWWWFWGKKTKMWFPPVGLDADGSAELGLHRLTCIDLLKGMDKMILTDYHWASEGEMW